MNSSRTPEDSWNIATGVGSTALMVAAQRAAETAREDALFEDPYSKILVAGAGPGVWAHMLGDGFITKVSAVDPQAGAYFQHMGDCQAVRTRFFDAFFIDAATAGIRQVAILASGLDARAYRLRWPADTTVFEVDLPHVLAYKASTLTAHGAIPTARRREVPADLRSDWPTALCRAGFDSSMPTVWLAEGLLMYLPAKAQDRLFEQITELSAPGSHVAAECLSPNAQDRRTQMQSSFHQLAAKFTSDRAEDVQDLMYDDPDRADLTHWLNAHGWTASATTSTSQMQRLGRWETSRDPEEDTFATFVVGRRGTH